LQVNESLRDVQDRTIARDFEQAIVDDDRSEGRNEVYPSSGRIRARRLTGRQGRPQAGERVDRSRDTSSSGSTSPANSVEAFAEPRRRQRANTAESYAPSFIENVRNRTYSQGTAARRPTLSNISLPPAATQRGDEDRPEDDGGFPLNEEPGKTYKIDFEELEEFVALSEQGLIALDGPNNRKLAVGAEISPRVFHDLRGNGPAAEMTALNVAFSEDSPLEKPLDRFLTGLTSTELDEKAFGGEVSELTPLKERFSFFSSEYQSTVFASKLGDFTRGGTTFRDMFEMGPDGGVWWLDVQNPTKAELDVIAKAFKIHRLTREDIEDQEPREKVELFPQYYFVCFRSFNMDKTSEDFLDPVHVYIVVCGDGVLSFSYSENPHARNVRKRISKVGDFMSLGPDYICYAMIDDIVDSFAPVIREAEHESESIEDQVFIAREDDFIALLRQIGECRRSVLDMMRLLGGKADVIRGFAKRCNDSYTVAPRGDIGLYLGDIQDHVVTMMSNLGHVEKMLSRSHANYLAQLNVDNILKGNSTNKNLAKITVIATILVPLNLVCGLFGMNVPVPGKDATGLGWFFGIVGVIVGFVILGIIVARRLKAI
jgi:magnesium transporter